MIDVVLPWAHPLNMGHCHPTSTFAPQRLILTSRNMNARIFTYAAVPRSDCSTANFQLRALVVVSNTHSRFRKPTGVLNH